MTRSHTWSLPEQVNLSPELAALRGRTFILYHPTAVPLDRAVREGRAFGKLSGHLDSVAVLIWELQPFPLPAPEVRRALAEAFARGPRVEAVAWVLDTSRPLGATLVQGVSREMFADGVPTQLFDDPFDAATWLAKQGTGETEDILCGLDDLDRATPDSRFTAAG